MLCQASLRLSAAEVLNNKWLRILTSKAKDNSVNTDNSGLLNLNIENLKKYTNSQMLKKAVLTFIASRLKSEDIHNLTEIFKSLDLNNDGYLSLDEFRVGCSKIKQTDMDIQDLFENIDFDKSGKINYTEFIAATIEQQVYVTEERLIEAFKNFDLDRNGKITAKELANIIKTENEDIDFLQDQINSFDKNGDGEIDYNEFCDMMGKKLVKRRSVNLNNILKGLK